MKQATKHSRLYKKEDFDLALEFFNCNIGDGDYNIYSTFHPASQSNHSYFNDPACTALIDKSRATYNDEERKALYHQLFDLLEDQMPMLPVYYEEICIGASKNVSGLQLSKIGAHKYSGVEVKVK